MPQYGTTSKERLATCEQPLQDLMNEVIKYFDCSIICGHRNQADQNKAVAEGVSKTPWPESKHNTYPSKAVDVMPYPIDWKDTDRIYMFVGIVRGIAAQMKIPIRCGVDWNNNMETKDQSFHDLPHIELID
jgi:peptidoglycan L-alanyl-D-glutamate endopeptidase CwlK